jgi:hypothetical protein
MSFDVVKIEEGFLAEAARNDVVGDGAVEEV